MLHQYGSGDRANTAGDGSDGFDDGLDLVELGVASDSAQSATGVGLVLVPVDGNVNDDLAGADKISSQAVQHAGCGHDDIGILADLSGVHSAGVAGGDSSVLAHEHHAGGLADDQRTANHNGVLALAVNAVEIQDLHTGSGGAGSVAQIQALENTGVGHMGHAVHVLLGVQTVADLVLVVAQVLGQGTEHQHAVDGIVGVDLIDHGQHIFLGSVGRQDEVLNIYANQLSPLGSALFIGQIGRIFAYADNAQSGGNTLFPQSSGTGLQISIQGIGNFLAQQQFCHNLFPPNM